MLPQDQVPKVLAGSGPFDEVDFERESGFAQRIIELGAGLVMRCVFEVPSGGVQRPLQSQG